MKAVDVLAIVDKHEDHQMENESWLAFASHVDRFEAALMDMDMRRLAATCR